MGQQKWGFTVQGGADLALTAKIASVKICYSVFHLPTVLVWKRWTTSGQSMERRFSKCLNLTSPLPSSTASLSSQFKWRGERSSCPALTRSGHSLARRGRARVAPGWDTTIFLRPCSTTALVIFLSQTTSPHVADLASRLTSTTTLLRFTPTTQLKT